MEHRTVKYDVRQIEPGKWIWIILKTDPNPIISTERFPTREQAVAACIGEINDWIERTRTR